MLLGAGALAAAVAPLTGQETARTLAGHVVGQAHVEPVLRNAVLPITGATPGAAVGSASPSPSAAASGSAARLSGARPAAAAVRRTASPQPAPRWVDPMPAGEVTSCFGPRWGRQHAGVDLAAAAGTPVTAAAAGVVVSAGANYGGYGISVLLQHPNGYLTHYAHLSATSVQPGQQVQAGQQLGAEGSTGNSTGPHLHFEVHQGTWKNTVDPTDWLRARGIDVGCGA
ncbi:M23 family metallopeptidase [Spirilliplanes yamanashiensis]|uniref:M23 family metallopeptidase n=1 Tax=Spirilliplanes yamanashiensis TaxID=42233 RepID=UPI002783E307|nr:murein DD-endopeptidase MepM/ murein hydrolase activator NlpD [Spirilliplanes yamanashiensis]